jgi:hypothetical protein
MRFFFKIAGDLMAKPQKHVRSIVQKAQKWLVSRCIAARVSKICANLSKFIKNNKTVQRGGPHRRAPLRRGGCFPT